MGFLTDKGSGGGARVIRLLGGAHRLRRIIDRDATVVSRLREAGAVLVAKLATGERLWTTCGLEGRRRIRGPVDGVARIVADRRRLCDVVLDRDGDGGVDCGAIGNLRRHGLKAYGRTRERWDL